MENKIVQEFEISIGDFAYGSEDIRLRFDNTTISFMASYMLRHEPMSTLITSIVVLENKEECENIETIEWKTEWGDEPGALGIHFSKTPNDDLIKIHIYHHEYQLLDHDTKYYRNQPDYEEETWDFVIPYSLYKSEVIRSALKMLKEYGLRGSNANWADGYETFPLNTLLKVMGRNVTRNEDEDCYRSNIFEELEFLTQALRKCDDK